ncbi:MAG: alpha-L-fucosidase [Muribaculaceae bacterium]|nr:alpha-L-fucosidase [Muribaculaceae bacterium]
MKKLLISLLTVAAMIPAISAAEPDSIPFANTIRVYPSDDEATIVAKAAHVVPTPNQLSALENEFIAFIHIGPNTFTRREWGTGMEDPKIFDLRTLDTDQWVKAMKDAGMRMALLTVKHHDGFVLWQSRYTDHGIMSTGFEDGKGDILRELAKSCEKYGMKLGVYLSPADLYQIESPDGLYGNLSPKTERTIPREVPGRPFADKRTFTFTVDDYNEYFLNQLFELLTEYGPIHEVWFDGAHPKQKGGQTYNYAAWKELIHTLAPQAVIFGREDIRWCGNEAGATRDTEWNVIPYSQNPDTANVFPDKTAQDLGSRAKLMGANYLHYQQPETDTSIREGWFYRDEEHQRTRSADDIFDIFERSTGGNATFLLNIPPNREGRFSQRDVDVLQEVGRRIRQTYGTDLTAGAEGPAEILDNDKDSYIDVTEPVTITLKQPQTINRLMIQEPIQLRGERIESIELDVWVDGAWKQVASATNVGYKRILRFPDVTTDRLRIRVTASRLTPAISKVSAHHYEARPPQLSIMRGKDGNVNIEAARQAFGWKTDGSNSAERLAAGYTVRYTTDGSEPDENSTLYTGPFKADAPLVKAVAYLNGMTGSVTSEQLGIDKNLLKMLDNTDADKSVAVDLGAKRAVNGIAYIPVLSGAKTGTVSGTVYVSDNGRKWKKAESFELGNLINGPTRRTVHFSRAAKGRYVKVVFNEAQGDPTIDNIDIF